MDGKIRTKAFAGSMAVVSAVSAVFLFIAPLAVTRAAPPDYAGLYSRGDYAGAYEVIRKRLLAIYDERVDNRRIPADFITAKRLEERININDLYRNRTAEGFFIENNIELHNLHLGAARCLFRLGRLDDSLNHYGQCLRFKEPEPGKDDVILSEIADVFRGRGDAGAYARALEAAYALNPENREHSRRLGIALYRTADRKKAIFHLERYVRWKGEGLEEPGLYLLIANLNEDIGNYLETARFYREYLAAKPDDGHIHFALGHLAFKRTGDWGLARASLSRALELLPEGDIFRRSKAYEYSADMAMKDLEFEKAADLYGRTIVYQDRIKKRLEEKDREIEKLASDIRGVKSSLFKKPDFDTYNRYEFLMEEESRLRTERKEGLYSYSKLNAGRVRWNMAECYERLGKPQEAMRYYRECIAFDYDPSGARDRMVKIQLKISRGY
ncbi:MAG: tetratricopeptide repeat protein [Spirochaetota bacterium]|nr:tetratricopeptide repeat protein [Spirochaetota bacterium]OPZ39217.1 MAG: Tetratricopeptide repeat protein [Spirochaetes bacterium ADurb.BinA120]HPI13842.1 tetratricopeptide repeat protein [Spirochaetota bacterium]